MDVIIYPPGVPVHELGFLAMSRMSFPPGQTCAQETRVMTGTLLIKGGDILGVNWNLCGDDGLLNIS